MRLLGEVGPEVRLTFASVAVLGPWKLPPRQAIGALSHEFEAIGPPCPLHETEQTLRHCKNTAQEWILQGCRLSVHKSGKNYFISQNFTQTGEGHLT